MKTPKNDPTLLEKLKAKAGVLRGDHHLRVIHPDEPFAVAPTIWWVYLGYALSAVFLYFLGSFFDWCPPYAQEVVKHLKGMPWAWAESILTWVERLLALAAVAAAFYHHLWRQTCRYWLTPRDLQVQSWVPSRHVQSIPYAAVKRMGFEQTALGYLLDYGHVEVDFGSPLGPVVLRNCPMPQAFLTQLQRRVERVIQPSTVFKD